jgi:hypothetical protein
MRQLRPNLTNPLRLLTQTLHRKQVRLGDKKVDLLLAVHVLLLMVLF